MTLSAVPLLLAYCVAIALASLLGGSLPGRVHMTHTRMQLVMSFVSGLMLGVAFFHLLPHSIMTIGVSAAVDTSVSWLMLGLIVMFLLLRMFHFHQHDFSSEEHAHHDHPLPEHGESGVHPFSWLGIALGLGLHTIIDGIALGSVMQGSVGLEPVGGVLGLGVFLAILLHKPLDAMSITAVMAAGGVAERQQRRASRWFALLCPLAALGFYFGVDLLGPAQRYLVGSALAFSAGAFICIALSDLLPEVHFHSHDRAKLTLAFLVGIALAWGIGSLEASGLHQH
jgi:zinc and cadmium transporter